MATFYIQLSDKLQKISGDLTAANITKALGYTPSDFSGDYNDLENAPMLDDESGEFNIVDELGNVVAKVNNQGVLSVDFIAGEHILSEKANKSDIPSIEGLATEKFVTDKIAEAELGGEDIDLSGYATKEDLEGLATEQWVEGKGYLTEHQDISNLATKDEIPSLEGYATEQWVEGKNYATKDEIPEVDFNSIKDNPFTENEDGTFVIADENGNIGMKLDKDGLIVKSLSSGDGKQLSTEDFTTALKEKLDGLSNYDDTIINAVVEKLRTDFDTLVSGDTATAIESFNEIIAFLDGIEDSQSLDSIIASIEQQIAAKYTKPSTGIPKTDLDSAVQTSLGKADTALQSYTEQYKGTVTGIKMNGTTKNPSSGVVDLGTVITAHQDISGKQDKLVSGTNIKTVNGTSILGSGNITISGGSSSGGTSSGSAAYSLVEHGTSDTTFTLTPNTFHVWDEVASLDLSFGDETSGVANEYLFQFTSGSTATTLTLPSDIKWANDSAPTIAENMIYQVSVLRGLASVLEFSNAASVFPATLVEGSNGDLGVSVYRELYEIAQGGSGTLPSGDLMFSLRGNNIPVTSFFYIDDSYPYPGYVIYDTGMEYYILQITGTVTYYFYD